VSNSKRAITSPADLKGMKFRVVGSPLFIETFTALGANPTQMSWADTTAGLASGAVDGQENPLSIFVAAKLQNVNQKFVTLWNYMNDPLVFVVNKDVWNAWTPADREIVRQAAVDAAKQQIELARKPLKQTVIDMGVGVSELTSAQTAEFVKLTRPVYNKWAKEIGSDLVNMAEKAVSSAK
jgi:TRAP-type C4-dicarboxylate transport system substrate-binding protein